MSKNHSKKDQQGFTLTELMIALVLGLLVAAAASIIFLQSKRNFLQNEQISRIQENGRYALKTLTRDISMAGFMGEHLDVSTITNSATVSNDCGAAGWFADFTTLLQHANEGTVSGASGTFPCISDPDYLAGTDAIAIKRVTDAYTDRIVLDDPAAACGSTPVGCTADDSCCIETGCSVPAACTPQQNTTYLQTNKNDGFVYHRGAGAPASQLAPTRENWQLLTRVYFIRPYSITGNNIPTLCRKVIEAGAMVSECLAEGVENMQIEIGIDSDGDGVPNYFSAAPDATEIQQAVSANIYLLVRGVRELASFNNSKRYNLGSTQIDAPGDGFARRVFSTTVQLRNFTN